MPGRRAYYADEEYRPGDILTDKILPVIDSSAFVIFDISDSTRPNVFLELGFAIGRGKPFLLLMRQGAEAPSDLRSFDRIEYGSFKDLADQIHQKAPSFLEHALGPSLRPIMPWDVLELLYKSGDDFVAWSEIAAANGASETPMAASVIRDALLGDPATKLGWFEGSLNEGFRIQREARSGFKSVLELNGRLGAEP